MPTIDIKTKLKPGVTIIQHEQTQLGDSITTSIVNGVSFISEDITKQTENELSSFFTSYRYVPGSLEIFINGMRVTPSFDYVENSESNGFNLIQFDAVYSKWLSKTGTIFVRYIKVSI